MNFTKAVHYLFPVDICIYYGRFYIFESYDFVVVVVVVLLVVVTVGNVR